MNAIANIHRQRIASLHLARHVYAGESRTLVFEKLDTANVPRSNVEIGEFEYSDTTADGRQLPPEAAFELRVSELVLSEADYQGTCSILHGDKRFRVVSPSPFSPHGMERFWRFWITRAEDED